MKRVLVLFLLTAVVAFSSGSPAHLNARPVASHATPQITYGAYTLIAWSELGMHCMDGKDYSIFSVLPPYNVIHAQLYKRGEPPVPVSSGVTITYQATLDTTRSINSISSTKTNFWTYVQALFHAKLNPDVGLAGYKVQGKKPSQMTYNANLGYWEAVGVPTIRYDDTGKFNPYPMAKLIAKDPTGQNSGTGANRGSGER